MEDPPSFDSTSEGALDPQPWGVTVLGEIAELGDSFAIRKQVTPSAPAKAAQLPLAMASEGDRLWVVRIKGGHRMQRRLTDVGIIQGSELVIISRTDSGSVIVALQGCRIGLGAGMAHRITVSTVHPALE